MAGNVSPQERLTSDPCCLWQVEIKPSPKEAKRARPQQHLQQVLIRENSPFQLATWKWSVCRGAAGSRAVTCPQFCYLSSVEGKLRDMGGSGEDTSCLFHLQPGGGLPSSQTGKCQASKPPGHQPGVGEAGEGPVTLEEWERNMEGRGTGRQERGGSQSSQVPVPLSPALPSLLPSLETPSFVPEVVWPPGNSQEGWLGGLLAPL